MSKLFGLIGNPLEHSFSENLFNKKFEKNNLDNRFKLYQLNSLEELKGLLKSNHLAGFTVTYPFKQSIIPYLDEINKTIDFVGAANVVCVNYDANDKPVLKGYNTDVIGFEYLFNSALSKIGKKRNKALILGTGGASKAVQFVLRKNGIHFVLVSRKHPKIGQVQYDALSQKNFDDFNIIINTTPLGMFPDVESCPPIPYEFLSKNHCLIDLIYNPKETKFLELGRKAGCITINGLQMLEKTVDATYEIWKETKKVNSSKFLKL